MLDIDMHTYRFRKRKKMEMKMDQSAAVPAGAAADVAQGPVAPVMMVNSALDKKVGEVTLTTTTKTVEKDEGIKVKGAGRLTRARVSAAAPPAPVQSEPATEDVIINNQHLEQQAAKPQPHNAPNRLQALAGLELRFVEASGKGWTSPLPPASDPGSSISFE